MKPQSREASDRFLLRYTLMFGCVLAAILAVFAAFGVGFLRGLDGPSQHYSALAYLGDWVRSGLSGEGWKMVDFSLGQGLDVLTTLSYYCFTEPLALLSALVPLEYSEILFGVLLFLRFYLSGLFAALLARRFRAEGWSAALCGVLYALSSYSMLGGMKHFNFGVGMMFLPLLLLAVERVFAKGRCGAYVAVAALQLVSNFYFAYMNTVIAIIYILVRLAQHLADREPVSKCAKTGTVLLGGYVLGAALSAVFFLPVAMAFLRGGRTSMETGYSGSMLHYPLSYYVKMVLDFFGAGSAPGYWVVVGFIPLTAFAMLAFFFRKGHERRTVRAMLCICALMLCVPLVGKFMNGMGYVTNRWSYALGLFVALATALGVQDLNRMGKREAAVLSTLLLAYAAAVAVVRRSLGALVEAALFVLTAAVLMCGTLGSGWLTKRRLQAAVSVLATVSLMVYSVFGYLPAGENWIAEYYPVGAVLDDSKNRMSAFENAAEDQAFYRVGHAFNTLTEHTGLYDNHAWRLGYNGVSYYWSILPSVVSEHYVQTWSNTLIYYYLLTGLGGDAGANTLASVKYLLAAEEVDDVIPQGFEPSGTADVGDGLRHVIYENACALPIGYTFDRYMSQETYDGLSAMEKRDALLSAAVVEGEVEGLALAEETSVSQKLDFAVKKGEASALTDGMQIVCEVPEEGEVFLMFDGVRHDFRCKIQATDFDVNGPSGGNRAYVSNSRSNFAYPQQGVILPMGVCEAGEAAFTVEVVDGAAFLCDDVEVYFRSTADYDRAAAKLGEDVLENVTVGVNCVSGTILLEETKWLQLAIPYSEGWTATVDGEAAELSRSGGMYMGLALEAGEHVVELSYCTPWLKQGALISAAAALVCIALAIVNRRRRMAA